MGEDGVRTGHKKAGERREHPQDPLIMSTLSSRAVVQGYDKDRRKGRCCCCFGGGCHRDTVATGMRRGRSYYSR